MSILVELRREVEAQLQAEADSEGVALTELARRLIEEHAVAQKVQPSADQEQRLMRIAEEAHALPTIDDSRQDEILGYDWTGLPSE
jgi:hypothetical protein